MFSMKHFFIINTSSSLICSEIILKNIQTYGHLSPHKVSGKTNHYLLRLDKFVLRPQTMTNYASIPHNALTKWYSSEPFKEQNTYFNFVVYCIKMNLYMN